ncbi:MAG: dockerin type I repeat-containing protein [Clostridia bacterium]|nr:dockerin type I repeat-containing protein [Clostridia bacterium]
MRKSRFISVFLAVLLLALCASPVYAAAPLGDLNGDGSVTAEDARMILRVAVKLEALSATNQPRADLDGDSVITAADARAALRIAVKLDTLLGSVLYSKAHPLFEKTFVQMHPNRSAIDEIYNGTSNWCCYYTIHDVYRPVLKTLGYSDDVINKFAPKDYPSSKVTKAVNSFFGTSLSNVSFFGLIHEWYIPSLLADYYLINPDIASTFVFQDYCDDVLRNDIIERTSNARTYKPHVGDIVFMSNKTETYVDGVPTIDHTAQIIKVNADGSFWCTEGSIIQRDEPLVARVRERRYIYNGYKLSYDWELNDVVSVLMIARPLLP